MASQERVGIVTVTFNSAKVLPDFLRCITGQTHGNFLLFAVDNASTDNSIEILRELSDERLRIIANSDNRGVAEGNNQGIRAALEQDCGFVLLINNDTEFGPELISYLLRALENNSVDMCCPKMFYFDEPNLIWAAGGDFQPWCGYRVIHAGEGEIDKGQYDRGRRITYSPTCCVLIRKKVFEEIGLMDPSYFVYADDTDFMFRAMRRGLVLWYLPEVRLWHKISSLTGGDSTPFAIRYMTRNRIYFYRKNFPEPAATLWTLSYRIHLLLRYLCGIDSAMVWKAKRQAMQEGFSMTASVELKKLA